VVVKVKSYLPVMQVIKISLKPMSDMHNTFWCFPIKR